jgi:hypothetical protein
MKLRGSWRLFFLTFGTVLGACSEARVLDEVFGGYWFLHKEGGDLSWRGGWDREDMRFFPSESDGRR